MNPPPPLEYSRRLEVSKLGQSFDLQMTQAERSAVAQRLDLIAINDFSAHLQLKKGQGGQVLASGELTAEVVQSCVVTLEPIPLQIKEAFSFVFSDTPPVMQDEDDFSPEDELIEPIINGKIEVGEPLVQELSLSLPPFPRKAGVEFAGFDK